MGYPEFGATDSLAFMYLTTRCNLICAHCYVGDKLKSSQDMPVKMVDEFLAYARTIGFRQVSFLGGEPLLYPSITYAVKRAHHEGFKVFLGTNGTCPPPDGFLVDYLSISADHCAPGGSDICHRAMDRGVFARLRAMTEHLSFTVTLTQKNANRIEGYLNAAAESGIDSVLFHYFTPLGNGREQEGMVIPRKDYDTTVQRIEDLASRYSFDVRYQKKFVRRDKAVPFSRATNLKYYGNKSRFLGEGLAIFPDGSVHFDPLFFDKDPVGFFTGTSIKFNAVSSQLEALFSIDKQCLSCPDKGLCGGPDSASLRNPQHRIHGQCCQEFLPIETTCVTTIIK